MFRKTAAVSYLLCAFAVAAFALSTTSTAQSTRPAPPRPQLAKSPSKPKSPKLIVVISVDQMRADYLERFAAYETGGLHFFATQGADFLNANYQHLPTETCVGHTTLLSGRNPSHTGIVSNNWYDRTSAKMVYCVDDAEATLVGGTGAPVSPAKLVGDNFSDWFQKSFPGARVYSFSMKDRAAILMGGHHPTGVYWFSTQNGAFVTSRYYEEQLPSWVADFDARGGADSYAGQDWTPLLDAASPAYHTHESAGSFPHHMPPDKNPRLYNAVYSAPFGDELLEQFAEAAVTSNQLGANLAHAGIPDLLEVGFSSNDAVGHAYGPDSPEIADEQIRLDRTLGKMMDSLNARLGAENILWVLSADHGVEPTPEAYNQLENSTVSARMQMTEPTAAVTAQLNDIFHVTGPMNWFAAQTDSMWYFNLDELKTHGISLADARSALAHKVHDVPGIEGFYDTGDLAGLKGWQGDLVRKSFFPGRSGDVYYISKEWTLFGGFRGGTSHSDPWPYDTHVPVVFAGWGIPAARISAPIHVADVAPTLAALLGVTIPADEPIDGKSLKPLLQQKPSPKPLAY